MRPTAALYFLPLQLSYCVIRLPIELHGAR